MEHPRIQSDPKVMMGRCSPPNDGRLVADECVAGSTIARLRAAGFDVISV